MENSIWQFANAFLEEKEKFERVGENERNYETCVELKEIERYTLSSMVKQIKVYEGRKIEIEFQFTDKFKMMSDFNRRILEKDKNIQAAERRT